uniref:Pyrokinin-5 n=1 Tax=Blattella germanica TaxID=6973 RepID=PPK5_BLAGE|nr:RecName: Full=Pyrokinin-5; AltName: Full=BlaGe-Capa-PK; AltName: Full=FXPRL-amide [Blattella germanica]
ESGGSGEANGMWFGPRL